MKLMIEIELDNEEAQTALENGELSSLIIGQYLEDAAILVEILCDDPDDTGFIHDGNGNRIGIVKIEVD